MRWTKVTMVRLKSLIGFLLTSHDQTAKAFFHLVQYVLLMFVWIRSSWTIASSICPALQLQKIFFTRSLASFGFHVHISSMDSPTFAHLYIYIYLSVCVYACEERHSAVGWNGPLTPWLGIGSCAVEMGFKSELEKLSLRVVWHGSCCDDYLFLLLCDYKDMLCRTPMNSRFQ